MFTNLGLIATTRRGSLTSPTLIARSMTAMCRRFCSTGEGMPTGFRSMERHPLAVLVDLDATRERLALAHEHLEHPADRQVVDLRDLTIDFEPQVVDDRPVRAVSQVEVDEVGGVRLRLRRRGGSTRSPRSMARAVRSSSPGRARSASRTATSGPRSSADFSNMPRRIRRSPGVVDPRLVLAVR